MTGVGGGAGEDTGPYTWYMILPENTAAFAALCQRFNLQVSEAGRATEAERQRVPTARLKTGVCSQDTFCFVRAAAAASEAAQ